MAKKKRKNDDSNGFEKWGGYMNAKISKLEAQFEEERLLINNKNKKLSNIFEGISIFVNGYTNPSADELRCLMLLHGGVYHHYYRSKKTTHIIASVLPNAKFDQFKTLKIVKSDWIIDSIKAGRLLNYTNYLLSNNFSAKKNLLLDFAIKKDNIFKNEIEAPKTAADDGYLAEFYSNSRLHYISALGARLKQYVAELREKHEGLFFGRKELLENSDIQFSVEEEFLFQENIVMHIDMDCFFVSVALRKHPHLKGKPVAVTHARGNYGSNRQNVDKKFEVNFYKKKMQTKIGINNKSSENKSHDTAIEEWSKEVCSMSEIASCSYEARKAGVSKGMYLGNALKLCPDLKTVPYDFEGYEEVSMALYNTIAKYTLDIESISCDELFVDCTSLIREVKISPMKFADILRHEIEKKTFCTASVGIGSNKLQARLATKLAKPNGQFHLSPDKVENFMKELDIYEIPGVGRSIGAKFENLSVKTCGDLQKIPLETLKKEFGVKQGETFYNHCRGVDDRKLNFCHDRKSVSAEVNYGIRFNDDEEAETFLRKLSKEVSKRLQELKLVGKSITFKVMFRAENAPLEAAKFLGHGACNTLNRSVGLPLATDDSEIIAKCIINLYHQVNVPANELRGIGIQVTKLENNSKFSKNIKTYFNEKKTQKESKSTTLSINSSKSSKLFKGEQFTNTNNKQLLEQNNKNPLQYLDTPSQIDFEVLKSLPRHIQLEVLNEYGIKNISLEKNSNTDSNTNNNDNNCNGKINYSNTNSSSNRFKKNSVNQIADEVQQKVENYKESETLFFKLNLNEMKNMIEEWVKSENDPQSFDVNLLKTYLKNLVEKKNLENLCILIRCFHRHIRTKKKESKLWHKTYNEVFDSVQDNMKKVFGRTLVSEAF